MRKQQKHFWPMFIAKYCILFICMCKQTVNDCWSFLCGLLLADVMLVSVPCYYVVHCVIQCLCSQKQKLLGVALSLQGVTAVLWCQSNISYYVYVWLWWWLDTSVMMFLQRQMNKWVMDHIIRLKKIGLLNVLEGKEVPFVTSKKVPIMEMSYF